MNVFNNSLCFIDTKTSLFKELVRFEKKENTKIENEQEDYLIEQQKELFDYYNVAENTKKRNRIIREKQTAWKRQPVKYANGDFEEVFVSSNEKALIYLISELHNLIFRFSFEGESS